MKYIVILSFFVLCVAPGYGQGQRTPPDTIYWSGDMVVGKLEVDKFRSRNFFADQDSSVVLLGHSFRPDVTRGEAFGTLVPTAIGYKCTPGAFLYGAKSQFRPVLFQVLHSDGQEPYIHLSFETSTCSHRPASTTTKQAWEQLAKHGNLHIGEETLRFADGIRMDNEDTDDFCYGMVGTGVCWKNTGIVLEENDIVQVGISSRFFADAPEKATVLRVQEGRAPGTAWLSWRIAAPANHIRDSVTEQLRIESEQGIRYEYRILRDGDAQWRTVQLEETETDGVDVVPTGLGHYLHYPRRKHLVTGLDPNGNYSFCIRAANATGVSDETCNLAIITPVSAQNEDLPYSVTLSQNYPNPFNPSTEIVYTLSVATLVRLEVFDMTGRVVATLVDDHRSVGAHAERFWGNGLPTGTYLYRLHAGAEVLTRTMTLVR